MKLGDMIANALSTIGVPPCNGCKDRQQTLNNFGDKLFRNRARAAARNAHLKSMPENTSSYTVVMQSVGIGDSVLGACVMPGLMDKYPGKVQYAPYAYEWVEALFNIPLTKETSGHHMFPYNSIGIEIAMKGDKTRAEYYAEQCGNVVPEMPPCVIEKHKSDIIVLCPSTYSTSRTWSYWEKLERILNTKTIVISDKLLPSQCFKGEVWIGKSPKDVVQLLADAKCVIAADTGMAHVAAATRTRTIVLCGPTNGNYVFGKVYPTVEIVNGALPCAGCYWQNMAFTDCGKICRALDAITAERVAELALQSHSVL
jgi:Glycosyltransferase family 9 (heptosyltransferase)